MPGDIEPIVHVRDGVTYADSRDVSAYFRRQHRHVLDAIRELHCSDEFRAANFRPFKIKDLTGESTSHVEMTKDGFAFLAFGFTGAEAGQFKERYIGRFNAMEAEMRDRPVAAPAINVRDPSQLASIAIQLIEVNKELETRVVTAEARVAAAAPKTDFYDRFVSADGLFGLQNAARVLGQPPNKFIQRMKEKYLFYQGSSLVPYREFVQRGLFEVKIWTDGEGKSHHSTFMTPKGLQYFAKKLGVTIPANDAEAA